MYDVLHIGNHVYTSDCEAPGSSPRIEEGANPQALPAPSPAPRHPFLCFHSFSPLTSSPINWAWYVPPHHLCLAGVHSPVSLLLKVASSKEPSVTLHWAKTLSFFSLVHMGLLQLVVTDSSKKAL
jgi:hypothetical protein